MSSQFLPKSKSTNNQAINFYKNKREQIMQAIQDWLSSFFSLNGLFKWDLFSKYLFSEIIIRGVIITIILSVVSQLLGTIIGFLLYLLRQTPLRVVGDAYIWFFRGTPLLLQIAFLFAVFPMTPLTKFLQENDFFYTLGFKLVHLESFVIVILAFSLNEGAYMAEIVRAGIDSIDPGQLEAGKSLGMTYGLAMRRIILPQSARVIIPPLGNEFNNMLKTTSLASAAALFELLNSATSVGSFEGNMFSILIVASVWYLLLTTLWGFAQSYLERRFNPTNVPTPSGKKRSLFNRLLGQLGSQPNEISISNMGR
jgi:polar amino acid transport system permease protein